MTPTLHGRIQEAASTHPDRTAVMDPARGRVVTYTELRAMAGEIAIRLARHGVGPGQRVGVCAPKSIPVVAAILGALEAGAAYVPVDATAPAVRGGGIFADCDVRAAVVERGLAEALASAWGGERAGAAVVQEPLLADGGVELVLLARAEAAASPVEGLAYILYTSGSTGKPKGVMHTHRSALAFVEWCASVFDPSPEDRFSSHAPFHFDLSILDLYVPLTNGATVVLIGEEDGKSALRLAPLLEKISVWYSTPSVLRLLVEQGVLADHDASDLRLVLFAGEVFPPRHLRRLQEAWPGRGYWNLYGPTETNVCTAYEIPGEVPADRVEPYAIGRAIDGDRTMVVGPDDRPVPPGSEGELVVHGGTVMVGYWNRPELDARAFLTDAEGRRWYRTGDVVRENEAGEYVFLGRRDRMIKRRGYRVELGEIEAVLYRHPAVREVAVVADPDEAEGVRVHAFLSWDDSQPRSTIAMKRFCAENLPLYMVPDRFLFLDALPKTSTDKIDYLRLVSLRG